MIFSDEIPDGYRVYEATCPTCGHEFEVLFGDSFSTSCMLGWWDDFECESCSEWFSVICFENGSWVTYSCDNKLDQWMFAAGWKQYQGL